MSEIVTPRFIQIAATDKHVYALDEKGFVWEFNVVNWRKLPNKRGFPK